MKLVSLKQLSFLLNSNHSNDEPVNGVAVDSRLVKKGNAFFALSGLKVDGHDYLESAVNAGASCLVVNKNYTGNTFGRPIIYVDDTLSSLQQIAKNLLSKRKSKIVAITGSVGKTTTKDFLTTLLSQRYNVSKTLGNANSQIGVPLTIINHTKGDEDVLVIEMGMNEKGQLKSLVNIAPPDIAILTHAALTHASNFHSLREIAFEKAEILQHPKTKFGIINHDIENIHEVIQIGTCSKISFSANSKIADYYFDDFTIQTKTGDVFKLNPKLHPYFGKHHYQNLTCAIACARLLEVSFEEIKMAESLLILPEKRFEIIEKNGIVFVNDSYNASEISVKASLESLPEPKNNGKKIAVIGEMLELGKFSIQCHKNVAIKALDHVDMMMLLGKECVPIFDHWKENKKPVELFLNRPELVNSLKTKLMPGDVVLLKGSSANQLWKILEEIFS